MGNGPRPEMAEKWPPKWKNGPKMGFWPFILYFSISVAIFRPFQAGGHFPFFSHFFGFLRRTGLPFCRWPPRTQKKTLREFGLKSGEGHPWTNTSVGETFEELSGPLVHTNFPRKRYGPMIGPY